MITGASIALICVGLGYLLCYFTNRSEGPKEETKENPYDKYKDPITGLYKRPSKAGGE